MKSNKLRAFIKEIQFKNRNPQDNSVLELLNEIETNPSHALRSGEFLYRSRLVTGSQRPHAEKGFWGYSQKESFVPPPEKTRDMRANYKFIPYLYCSRNPYISICEVRPRYGARVSVATIVVSQEMQMFDLTLAQKPKGLTTAKENLCEDLAELFSQPVTQDDDVLDYIPTQYIAEYLKNLGYGGIMYHSAMNNSSQEIDAANFVIFDYHKCEPIKSNLFCVEEYYLGCRQCDGDPEELDVRNRVEIILDQANNGV